MTYSNAKETYDFKEPTNRSRLLKIIDLFCKNAAHDIFKCGTWHIQSSHAVLTFIVSNAAHNTFICGTWHVQSSHSVLTFVVWNVWHNTFICGTWHFSLSFSHDIQSSHSFCEILHRKHSNAAQNTFKRCTSHLKSWQSVFTFMVSNTAHNIFKHSTRRIESWQSVLAFIWGGYSQ